MQTFNVTGIMACIPMANIDTDMLIPKTYLKTTTRSGLGQYLFAELRYDERQQPNPHFILNHPPFDKARILLTGENFGCGSSREHAVWALLDFGIRVIIAPSFADIFYSNCFKNGVLPVTLSDTAYQKLSAQKEALVTVDLVQQRICTQELTLSFTLEASRRVALLEGRDEIDTTLTCAAAIADFEAAQKITQPWLFTGEEHG